MNPIEFADRLFRRLTGKLSDREEKEIDDMIASRPDLTALSERLRDKEYVRGQITLMNSFDVESAWAKVSSILPEEESRGSRRRAWLWWCVAAAASVTILLSVGIDYWLGAADVPAQVVIAEDIRQAMDESEQHGITGAVVEETVAPASLRTQKSGVKTEKSKASDGQTYEDMMKATRITTFYNKEYWLTLSDNTVVHLARNTRIVFPERFGKDSREIYLSGEAYFIVSPDKERRFVIHTDAAETIVYGTELNVISRDKSTCSVALVSGSAGVRATEGGNEQMLIPGEEAVVNNGVITMGEADLPVLKAWNSGHVEFSDWPLSRLMEVIGRWYGKEARFESRAYSSMEVSGSFDRYDELSSTIESLATVTGADIEVDELSIRVK